MSSQRLCQQGKSKSMRSIAGHAARGERRVVVEDLGDRVPAGKAAPTPTRSAAARSRAHSAASEPASRGIRRSLVGDEVEQHERAQLAAVAARVGLRAAQAGRVEVGLVVGRLLAVEEHEAQLGRAGRALARRSARASSTTAAVPPAPSLAPTKPGSAFVS